MPLPIWNFAADCVVEILQRDILMTNAQVDAVKASVCNMPASDITSLLCLIRLTPFRRLGVAMFSSQFRVEGFVGEELIYVLDTIRVLLGQESWFPTDSAGYTLARREMQAGRLAEIDGLTFADLDRTRTLLITCTEDSKMCDDVNDDDITVATVLMGGSVGGDTASVASSVEIAEFQC